MWCSQSENFLKKIRISEEEKGEGRLEDLEKLFAVMLKKMGLI
jgi:hypothetical protein